MRLLHSVRWLLLALVVTLIPVSSHAGVFISVNFAPPILPVYVQPVCPEPGLMWVPGYWAYGDDGYYWVPGAWVPAPYVGALWTPGYWGWGDGVYIWHAGYWGPHVGYYGGVNYGFGYGGIGFFGGRWNGGVFAYNTAVMRVGNGGNWGNRTYVDRTIVEHNTIINNNHVSYSGGPGGINHQPTPEERMAEHEQHNGPTSIQAQHESTFRSDRTAYAKVNGGHPQRAALERPLGSDNRQANNVQNHANPNFQNHVNPQTNARPVSPQTNARPMERPESATRSNPSMTERTAPERTAPRNETINRGNPPAAQHTAPRNESIYHSNPPANERPMERPESMNHGNPPANPPANPRPMERSESMNHNPGGGNPRPNPPAPRTESRPAPQARPESRPAPQARPESRPAPQARPEEKREH